MILAREPPSNRDSGPAGVGRGEADEGELGRRIGGGKRRRRVAMAGE